MCFDYSTSNVEGQEDGPTSPQREHIWNTVFRVNPTLSPSRRQKKANNQMVNTIGSSNLWTLMHTHKNGFMVIFYYIYIMCSMTLWLFNVLFLTSNAEFNELKNCKCSVVTHFPEPRTCICDALFQMIDSSVCSWRNLYLEHIRRAQMRHNSIQLETWLTRQSFPTSHRILLEPIWGTI